MKSAALFGLLLAAAPLSAALADEAFTVTPGQAVSVGAGEGDAFAVERISRNENTVVVLLRPKGEDCTFRFSVNVGQSVQLRTQAADGQSFLCKATLRPIIDDAQAQFAAECAEQAQSNERKCPPGATAGSASSK